MCSQKPLTLESAVRDRNMYALNNSQLDTTVTCCLNLQTEIIFQCNLPRSLANIVRSCGIDEKARSHDFTAKLTIHMFGVLPENII